MKILLIVSVAFLSVAQAADSPKKLEPNWEKRWVKFKIKYGRIYATSKEDQERMKIFKKNQEYIDVHNAAYRLGKVTSILAMNEFGDMRADELARWVTGLSTHDFGKSGNDIDDWTKHAWNPANKSRRMVDSPTEDPLPTSVDWRNTGAVRSVKHQGSCGSCWAFAAAGAIEAQHFKKTGNIRSLSAQNLVDCSTTNGCTIGSYVSAFLYLMRHNNGIETDETYPYEGIEGTCRYNPMNKYTNLAGYGVVSAGEERLKTALANVGPIAVGVDASRRDFIYHYGGIHNDPGCSSDPGHAVLAVGYGTDTNGIDYWIIKNSWGPFWGEGGYAKMIRNKNNQCGIATLGAYPIV